MCLQIARISFISAVNFIARVTQLKFNGLT